MIASERRIVSEGETRHSLTKKLALSGRPVKIYVIDPKQFQARLQKYSETEPKKTDVKSGVKKTQKSEESQQPQPSRLQKCGSTNKTWDNKNNYSAYREVEDQYKTSRPVLIAPKEPQRIATTGGTTIFFPPATTILPLQTMIPVSLSLPLMSVGTALGGTAVGNVISVPTGIVTTTTNLSEDSSTNVNPKKKVLKKSKRPVKRKVAGEMSKRTSISEEKAEAAEMAFLMKESTTRTGRVSKSNTMASAVAAAASTTKGVVSTSNLPSCAGGAGSSGTTNTAGDGKPKAKKRELPEKFRCQTCQRFYLGNAKFNQHFSKYPDHVKPDPNVVKSKNRKINSSKALSLKSCDEHQKEGASSQIDSGIINLEEVGMEMVDPPSTNTENKYKDLRSSSSPSNSNRDPPFTPTAMDEDSFGVGSLSPIMRRTTASVPNPDTLSDNCTSPKNLPVFNMTSSSTMFSQRLNDNEQQQPNNSVQDPQTRREYFMEFQTDFNNASTTNNALCHQIPGNGSHQSFNSLENMLSSDSNSHLGTRLQSPSIEPLSSRRDISRGAVTIPASSCGTLNTDVSTFFSAASTSLNTSSDLEHHLHNSSVNVSSYISVNSCRNPVPSISSYPFRLEGVDEESRDACLSTGGNQTHSPNQGQPKRRSIWEFVKEQIRLCGINQTCGEISEMADKLSKIARDKFYPIQEDEAERLGTASPVIQVDTPFISHLLDLPFGTYVFKEDGGIRKIVPPPTPVSTELSLTNGVEVDVDKFLSPDIDLISLPHLTNLDFNSICN